MTMKQETKKTRKRTTMTTMMKKRKKKKETVGTREREKLKRIVLDREMDCGKGRR